MGKEILSLVLDIDNISNEELNSRLHSLYRIFKPHFPDDLLKSLKALESIEQLKFFKAVMLGTLRIKYCPLAGSPLHHGKSLVGNPKPLNLESNEKML